LTCAADRSVLSGVDTRVRSPTGVRASAPSLDATRAIAEALNSFFGVATPALFAEAFEGIGDLKEVGTGVLGFSWIWLAEAINLCLFEDNSGLCSNWCFLSRLPTSELFDLLSPTS
jgi:hypothetical protein